MAFYSGVTFLLRMAGELTWVRAVLLATAHSVRLKMCRTSWAPRTNTEGDGAGVDPRPADSVGTMTTQEQITRWAARSGRDLPVRKQSAAADAEVRRCFAMCLEVPFQFKWIQAEPVRYPCALNHPEDWDNVHGVLEPAA